MPILPTQKVNDERLKGIAVEHQQTDPIPCDLVSEARGLYELTQADFGTVLGVGAQQVYLFESGRSALTGGTRRAFLYACACPHVTREMHPSIKWGA